MVLHYNTFRNLNSIFPLFNFASAPEFFSGIKFPPKVATFKLTRSLDNHLLLERGQREQRGKKKLNSHNLSLLLETLIKAFNAD